jgi:hypothetical protein
MEKSIFKSWTLIFNVVIGALLGADALADTGVVSGETAGILVALANFLLRFKTSQPLHVPGTARDSWPVVLLLLPLVGCGAMQRPTDTCDALRQAHAAALLVENQAAQARGQLQGAILAGCVEEPDPGVSEPAPPR